MEAAQVGNRVIELGRGRGGRGGNESRNVFIGVLRLTSRYDYPRLTEKQLENG